MMALHASCPLTTEGTSEPHTRKLTEDRCGGSGSKDWIDLRVGFGRGPGEGLERARNLALERDVPSGS